MGFFSSLASLFSGSGGSQPDTAEAVEYQGYTIVPTPQSEGGQFRVAAVISKGEQEHRFIRSDVVASRDECIEVTLRKAKMTIDQQGDSIF
jgi:hypothetical protein